jgi:carboxymethylenebutenolidase
MPNTKTTIQTRDGQAPAYIFTPSTGEGPWPAVLVFQDGRGIRPALFALAERVAEAGYYVLSVDSQLQVLDAASGMLARLPTPPTMT